MTRIEWYLLGAMAMTTPVMAQDAAVIVGSVGSSKSEKFLGVPRASLMVGGTPHAVTADSAGRFRIGGLPAGEYTLHARQLGYAPANLAVRLLAGETLHVALRLAPLDAQQLETIDVRSWSPINLRQFEERRAQGTGSFLGFEDIRKLQARQVTDVLRRVPGLSIRMVSGPYGDNPSVVHRGSRCPVMFFLNGAPFPILDTPVNNFVSSDDLIAVEVYAPSELPSQFNSTAHSSRCGVVGLWTRAGNIPRR